LKVIFTTCIQSPVNEKGVSSTAGIRKSSVLQEHFAVGHGWMQDTIDVQKENLAHLLKSGGFKMI
jgi:hypothetical protein